MKNRYFFEVTDTYGGETNYCWVHRYIVRAASLTGAVRMVNREEGYRLRKVMDAGDFVRWDAVGACVAIMGSDYSEDSDGQYFNVKELP